MIKKGGPGQFHLHNQLAFFPEQHFLAEITLLVALGLMVFQICCKFVQGGRTDQLMV